MRKFVSMLLVVLVTFVSMPLMGAGTEPLEKGMFFGTSEDCRAAYEAGNFRFYQPAPGNLKAPPVSAKGLPRAGCALEEVRENKAFSPAWVILAPNTPVVFGVDGTPSQDGRCHNKLHRFVELPLLRGLKGDMGPQGPPGRDGIDGRDFTPNLVAKKSSGWCGFWTNTGCTILTIVVVGAIGGIALSGGGGKDNNTVKGAGNTIP